MARVKITLIGGGSYGWTPCIVKDLCLQEDLEGEIVLEDIDPEPLKLTEPLSKKIAEMTGGRFTVRSTTDQTDALTGADFVVLTISTGKLATMYHDLEIPRKYGIHQPVGDTVGPGGLCRGLRNIPVIVDMAKEMERVCPNAWFFNYTNPMTTLTRSIYKYTSIRAIGLCHELFGTRHMISKTLDVPEDELDITVAGVNHFIWILRCMLNGQDALQMLLEAEAAGGIKGPDDTNLVNKTALMDGNRAKLELLKVFGALPAEGDRHLVEFVPYFLTEHAKQAADFGVKMTYISEREDWYNKDKARVERRLAGNEEIELDKSGEAVSELISSLANHRKGGKIDIVNVPNRGQIANLPMDAVVETLGIVGPHEVTPLSVGNLPPAIQAMCNTHIQNQEMVIEAAMTGNRKLALQAMYNDPLVKEFDFIPQMFEEMLEANKDYLPIFFKD